MTFALVCLGFLAGAGIAWFLTKGQVRFRVSEAVAQLESKTREAEAKAGMLAEQTGRYESDLKELRNLLSKESESKTVAMTRLEESLKNIDEQKKNLDAAQKTFEQTLETLSNRAIKSSSEEFLGQAKNVVTPLEKILERYEKQINELEQSRATAYGGLKNQIDSLISTQQLLQKETGNLVATLKTPQLRGKWGEATLKRMVELAGMVEHCTYEEQEAHEKDTEGNNIPDMVINLPGNRHLVVDSKFPDILLSDEPYESLDEISKKNILAKHAENMRRHMKKLSGKEYWKKFQSNSPEHVIMFIPMESSISAAFSHDPNLLQEAAENHVIIAGPILFYSLLLVHASIWRQEQVAKNSQAIVELGSRLYERIAVFVGNFSKTRDALDRTVKNFNLTVGSLESRVLHDVKRLKELGVSANEIPSVDQIEQAPRYVEEIKSKSSDAEDLFISSSE